jgi:outer membrane immunogenic protein
MKKVRIKTANYWREKDLKIDSSLFPAQVNPATFNSTKFGTSPMKRCASFMLAAFITSAAMPALADDILPVSTPIGSAAYTPTSADWTGAYVGGSIGYGRFIGTWCDNGAPGGDCDNLTAFSLTQASEPSGALFGISAGYDWQNGNIVYGVVGDISTGDLFVNDPMGAYGCGAGGCELSVNWMATLRGRVGYASSDRLLTYATAGAAFTNVTVNLPTYPPSVDEAAMNGVVGLGVEYLATDTMSLGLEYLHVIERADQLGSGTAGSTDFGVTDFTGDIVRLTAAYRF